MLRCYECSVQVGLVMGKGGETIRQICMMSGAHCQVDKNAPEGSREKNIVIKGKQECVLKAKVFLEYRKFMFCQLNLNLLI